MRLLHSTCLKFAVFDGEDIPPYAILSHTWDSEEVTLSDMQQPEYQHLKGFAKIQGCCAQAAQEDLEWVWIDTCCIDKSSSAELSEAINSMFKWYQKADVCFVYLSDVPPLDPFLDRYLFEKARWFTRGWCLQELLAPREVEFFADNWTELGTKWSLQQYISDTTSIPTSVLLQKKELSEFSVAERMSWASKRDTKREEDMAYCLLGIFDINMPLLYGEGRRSFIRLQETIMRREVDYSIFLWRSTGILGNTGLLCDSPHYFPTAGVPIRSGGFCKYSEIVPSKLPMEDELKPPEVTPSGLQITVHTNSSTGGSRLAWIYLTHKKGLICIVLSPRQPDYKYYRFVVGYVEVVDGSDLGGFHPESLCVASFTNLSIPKIPPQALPFKICLSSTTDEKLSILEMYPAFNLQDQKDNSYNIELDLASCPEVFIVVCGVERDAATYRSQQFTVAFCLFHGPWTTKILNTEPGASLESLASEMWDLKPLPGDSDRAISRLRSGSYVTVALKKRARANRSSLHISLVLARPATDPRYGGESYIIGLSAE
ncbi:het domain-containing protein [Fusarium flagelliforme]|uniref:Het domain-containing protein n=1 Tax=Fusarium flagelliforme TaxID=2675880 RepID=A0A395MR45_9HYPO|nr:het domain-containing protein [Fusarium flagelliforme]